MPRGGASRRDLRPHERAAWGGFLRTHARVVRELDAELLARSGLPLTSFDVLVQVSFVPERRLKMSDLADAVVLSRSGVTRLVDRLERQGLLERRRCEEDSRAIYAVLTERGAARLEEAMPVHLDGVRERFLEPLSGAQKRQLTAIWRRLGA